MAKTLITCDCLGSQTIDAKALSEATGLDVLPPCTALCTSQAERAAKGLTQGNVAIACTQESRLFEALAEELDQPAPALVDLRDRAGWSADPASKLPKMSALLAEALLAAAPGKSLDVISEGLCLILGPADVALAAAAGSVIAPRSAVVTSVHPPVEAVDWGRSRTTSVPSRSLPAASRNE